MKKRVKGLCTLLLAGALAATLLPGLPGARAAGAVDTSQSCKLEIIAGSNVGDTYKDLVELKTEEVTVKLYKVAEIDTTGKYTATDDFSGMDFGYIEYDSEGTATADAWNERAAEAAEKVDETTVPAATMTVQAGQTSAIQEGLSVGLYLIVPDTLTTDYFTYTFTPSLVSLPNNYYYTTGNDDWVYELTGTNAVTLKPEQTERLGNLRVTKTLDDFSATAGERATFIFQVSYTTPIGETVEKMLTMAFDKTGTQDLTVEGIPAGSAITVEEVYSGASYELVSDPTVTVEAVADNFVETSFENKHSNSPNGGYGIVNHFSEDETGSYQNSQLYGTDAESVEQPAD